MKNRWLIALSAVGIHISIGSVYAWSVAAKPIMNLFGCSMAKITFTFSVAIFFLGLSAAFLGHFVEKKGPRIAGMLTACFFGLGIAASGLAVRFQSLWLLYLCYGVLGGIGLGIGYVTPVSTMIKWFPDKRGLATGLAIMGFGFAGFISSFAMRKLMSIESIGIEGMFYILGGVYFVVIFMSSQYLSPPPKDWMPADFKSKLDNGVKKIRLDLSQLNANQAVKTLRFYCLWLILFINICCGISVISVASPLGQELAGLSVAAAAGMVAIIGIFNGLGRIGWSCISDHIGRPATWTLFFVIQILAFSVLPKTTNPVLFQTIVFVIITCYGGGFASMPAYISDLFGTKQISAILGYILTAWSAAGIIGPMLLAYIKDRTQSYSMTLYIFCGFFFAALAVSTLLTINIRAIKIKKQDAELSARAA
ncbi:MAG: OFA family MFS transporter [Phycisphaerae bacterium]|jgi:OFA family oxalate/formate antiporter-like MFS transporter